MWGLRSSTGNATDLEKIEPPKHLHLTNYEPESRTYAPEQRVRGFKYRTLRGRCSKTILLVGTVVLPFGDDSEALARQRNGELLRLHRRYIQIYPAGRGLQSCQ